jgi:hypothetical protein
MQGGAPPVAMSTDFRASEFVVTGSPGPPSATPIGE